MLTWQKNCSVSSDIDVTKIFQGTKQIAQADQM